MSQPTVRAFRAFSYQQRHLQPLAPTQSSFAILVAATSIALNILNSRQGHQALRRTARRILEDSPETEAANRTVEQADVYTDYFLGCINTSFPCIVVTDLRRVNGRTTKLDWDKRGLRHYAPRCAAVIEINSHLVRRAYEARMAATPGQVDTDGFYPSVLRIGITIAHEVCHVLTSYLLINKRAQTPPDVTAGAFGTDTQGEAGRYWEKTIFGGDIDFRVSHSLPNHKRIVVALCKRGGRNLWMVEPKAVKALIHHGNMNYLPLLDDHEFEEGMLRRIDAHRWSMKDDFYKGANSQQPKKLPEDILLHLTAPESYPNAYLIGGAQIQNWITNMHHPVALASVQEVSDALT